MGVVGSLAHTGTIEAGPCMAGNAERSRQSGQRRQGSTGKTAVHQPRCTLLAARRHAGSNQRYQRSLLPSLLINRAAECLRTGGAVAEIAIAAVLAERVLASRAA